MRIDSFEKQGLSFGLTSGIITTLGLTIGLYATDADVTVVLGGIVVAAVADALSDSIGVHMSDEAINMPQHAILESTLSTFAAKIISSLSFAIPVMLLPLSTAIVVDIIYGLLLMVILSYYIARQQKTSHLKIVINRVVATIAVILLTHYIGLWIKKGL